METNRKFGWGFFPSSAGVLLALSTLALAQSSFGAESADASDEATKENTALEEIVVTGTLLRGVAPIGTQTLAVTAEDVVATGATTTPDLLASIPQIGTFNSEAYVPTGSSNQVSENRILLRDLPGSAGGGSSTLILLDGHRLPGMGIMQTFPDPDAIAPGAIERVEIALDGGSSIYGSDAVGGVVNFITRKNFDGIEAKTRYGFGTDFQKTDTSLTMGDHWGNTSAYVTYDYAWHESLTNAKRYYHPDTDYTTDLPANLTCNPGNVTIGATNYALPGLVAGPGNRCDNTRTQTYFPAEARHSVFAGADTAFTDSLSAHITAFYTHREDSSNNGPLTGTATVSPSSPYYESVAGANAGMPEIASFNFSPLGGGTSQDRQVLETWQVAPSLTWNIDSNWQLRGEATYGRGMNMSRLQVVNTGALTTDVATGLFNPYSVGSAGNLALVPSLLGNETYGKGENLQQDARVVVDGSLFKLPGGDLRLATGVEYLHESYVGQSASTNIPYGDESEVPYGNAARTVWSAFYEVGLPIFGAGNRLPSLYSLSLDASGRYDHYSDAFGGTFNPKFGLNYAVLDWLSLRGNWGRSFQAPSLADGTATAPVIGAFPFVLFGSPYPGQTPINPLTQPQILLGGGNAHLVPETAKTWSAGFVLKAPVAALDGLSLEMNYYNITFDDLIDEAPIYNTAFFFPYFKNLYTLNPTDAQIIAFASQAANGLAAVAPYLGRTSPATKVYSIESVQFNNFGGVVTNGLDYTLRYNHRMGFGTLYGSVAGTYAFNLNEQAATGSPFAQDVGNYPRTTLMITAGAVVNHLRGQLTFNSLGGYNVPATNLDLHQAHVSAFNTYNLFLEYDVKGEGLKKDLSFTVNANNLLNTNPPNYFGQPPNGIGYSIGRVIELGVNKKF